MSARLSGVGAAPGIAVAPMWRYRSGAHGAPSLSPDVDLEIAASKAADDLWSLADRLRSYGRPDEAGILEAQALMAVDPVLLEEARDRIASGATPRVAIIEASETFAATIADLPDELLAARAADVRDVGARIARVIAGASPELPTEPSIAVADDLPPSITAEIEPGLLLGIALQGGSRTAHAVILARGLGIPAVVGIADLLEVIDQAGAATPQRRLEVAIDGETGELVIAPTRADRIRFDLGIRDLAARAALGASLRARPAALLDGERVLLMANIGDPTECSRAIEAGAEGVGLFRTEFLFMRRGHPPSETEQVEAYRQVFAAFGNERPVVTRLADIGGDKDLPYLGLRPEANPFLGVRAIRLAYTSREMLTTQFRAIFRAGALASVTPHVMAPMVASVADVTLLLELRDAARSSLLAEGLPCAENARIGIMVEIPAAALIADHLASMVDFFSIGTNDLTQYAMAADRGNAALGSLQDALHPAVLRLIDMCVRGADLRGIPVAVCGELAGDPAGAIILTALGVDELSTDAGSFSTIKTALSRVTRADLDRLRVEVLAVADADSVRSLAARFLGHGR